VKRTVLFLLLLLSALVQAQEPPVYLGGVFNLAGAQGGLDEPSYQGAKLAVDLANRKGGLLGGRVEMVLISSDSEVEQTEALTREALENQPELTALMGLSDSDQVLAAARVGAEFERVFLTSGATSPRLPDQVPEYLFLACFGDNVQAAAGAEFCHESLEARKVVVLYDDSLEYTRLLQNYFQTRFKQLGGEVVAVSSFERDDFSGVKLPDQPFDLVYLAAGPEEVLPGIHHLRKTGYTGKIMGGDGYDNNAWQGQSELNNIYYTTHAYLGKDNPNPIVERFRRAYRRAYKQDPDAFAGLGFDAMNLLIAAVKRASSAKPSAVLAALAETEDFEGVTGRISFAGDSRVPRKSVTVMSVQKGKAEFMAEIMPKDVPSP
jgi:branched-chain amino acid transport system substrate-binding protein